MIKVKSVQLFLLSQASAFSGSVLPCRINSVFNRLRHGCSAAGKLTQAGMNDLNDIFTACTFINFIFLSHKAPLRY